MKCLSTRTTPDGFKRRRYEAKTGARHTTIEIPAELWATLNGQGRARNRVEEWRRARDRESLRRQGVSLDAAGWDPSKIAEHLKVSRRTVNRWTQTDEMAQKRARFKALMEGGWTGSRLDLAHHLGVSLRTVYRWMSAAAPDKDDGGDDDRGHDGGLDRNRDQPAAEGNHR